MEREGRKVREIKDLFFLGRENSIRFTRRVQLVDTGHFINICSHQVISFASKPQIISFKASENLGDSKITALLVLYPFDYNTPFLSVSLAWVSVV